MPGRVACEPPYEDVLVTGGQNSTQNRLSKRRPFGSKWGNTGYVSGIARSRCTNSGRSPVYWEGESHPTGTTWTERRGGVLPTAHPSHHCQKQGEGCWTGKKRMSTTRGPLAAAVVAPGWGRG